MATIPQNRELLKHLIELLEAHRSLFGQERVYRRVVMLVLAEIMVFARHTVTQLLMSLGLNAMDWSAWYRLFSEKRFNAEAASGVILRETLRHVSEEALYVVAVDGTQTARSSRKMEGSGWLRNLRTPVFMVGIHAAQRWLNGSWLTPAEQGYSRALPLRWLPAFTKKSQPKRVDPMSESQAALHFIEWLQAGLVLCGRAAQRVLVIGDGGYDTLELWQQLPAGIILCVRSAKNRALYELAPPQQGRGRHRLYGDKAPTPQEVWRTNKDWQPLNIMVRGKMRHLQVCVRGPFLRRSASQCPLMLIVVRGKDNARTRRDPLPFLVNAQLAPDGKTWQLPLPVENLLFWMWQRWEVEVCHRELKSNFGLGNKQCWNPTAAVVSVQWSAWVYALLLLAGYRTWGLCNAPPVPTGWWSGGPRWSLNTLWRSYRAALWGDHQFRALYTQSPYDWLENSDFLFACRNAVYGSARS